MKELNNIISRYRSELDKEIPLEGDFERFMAKCEDTGVVDSPKWWRVGRYAKFYVATSVVLFIAVEFAISYFSPQKQIVRVYENYCHEVAALSAEMQMMVSPDEIDGLNRMINSIDYEEIPFMSILPDEMNDREKLKLIKEYYGEKLAGVKKYKEWMSEANEDVY